MGKKILGVLLLAIFFIPVSHAQENQDGFSKDGKDKEVKVIEGRLSRYGANYVVVNGEKCVFCESCIILDDLDHPIESSGLIATERVQVTLIGSCAREVKVTLLRQ